jgi:hypothetical protein
MDAAKRAKVLTYARSHRGVVFRHAALWILLDNVAARAGVVCVGNRDYDGVRETLAGAGCFARLRVTDDGNQWELTL